MILARQTLDCANKLRIHYDLPAPVLASLGDYFPDAEVTVDAFSRLVQGAKDHLVIQRAGVFRAAGVIGEQTMVVTFGKPGGDRPDGAVSDFELGLSRAGFGSDFRRS
ncbi:MAG: hypothetical protein HYV63_07770 [Candidatus Schekmanbacteria bacterium]|nr:hypothetical protein [Candidatus Schekmanbacteria bacterium]